MDRKHIVSIVLAAALALCLAACGAKGKEQTTEPTQPIGQTGGVGFVNGELTLNVPSEVSALVLVDMPQDDPDGVLYTVSEKASVEAGKADGHDAAWGDGWLFGIRRVDADTLHELLCWDMSGAQPFAKDAEGNYYLFTHPTDVRLYRQNEAYADAAEQWTMLNDWAWDNVRADFLKDNAGLEPYTRGNSMLDMYLARAAYQSDADYTVSTVDYGPLVPEGVDAAPYVERLMGYASCETVDAAETPDGEYVVLNFPAEEVRFDFFRMEGKQNYVRQVGYNGEYLMKLTYADGTKATEVMQAWYDELAANAAGNAALGYTADDLVGVWAEKTAGLGTITVTKADEGVFNVEIVWRDSAATYAHWEMTATPYGAGGALRYENGKHFIRTFTSETEYTDEEQYDDGSGLLYLNSAFEIMWEDKKDGAGDNCVFVNATPDYAPDDLVGVWGEKTVGLGTITVTKADEGVFNIEIVWRDNAATYANWEMTATPFGTGGALRYENARHFIRTFASETEYTDEEQYADGSGLFYLNNDFEVVWKDEKGGAGDGCVFVKSN